MLFLLGSLAIGCGGPVWQSHDFPSFDFQVEMPSPIVQIPSNSGGWDKSHAELIVRRDRHVAPALKLGFHALAYRWNDTERDESHEERLDRLVNWIGYGRLKSTDSVVENGSEIREHIREEQPEYIHRLRFIASGQYGYVVYVTGPEHELRSPDAERFFKSFQIKSATK